MPKNGQKSKKKFNRERGRVPSDVDFITDDVEFGDSPGLYAENFLQFPNQVGGVGPYPEMPIVPGLDVMPPGPEPLMQRPIPPPEPLMSRPIPPPEPLMQPNMLPLNCPESVMPPMVPQGMPDPFMCMNMQQNFNQIQMPMGMPPHTIPINPPLPQSNFEPNFPSNFIPPQPNSVPLPPLPDSNGVQLSGNVIVEQNIIPPIPPIPPVPPLPAPTVADVPLPPPTPKVKEEEQVKYSPSRAESEEEQEILVIRPKVLGKEKAKKRLLAFSMAKQNLGTKNTLVKTKKLKEEPKKEKMGQFSKSSGVQQQFRATINSIEEEKKLEQSRLLASNLLTSGKLLTSEDHKHFIPFKNEIMARVPKPPDMESLVKEEPEVNRSKRSHSHSKTRSSSRSKKSKSPNRKESKKEKNEDSERRHRSDKKEKQKETVVKIPDDWTNFKKAGLVADLEFHRIKNKVEQEEKKHRRRSRSPDSSEIKPVFNYLTKAFPKGILTYKAKPDHPIYDGKISYANKTIKFTSTKPMLTWAEKPSVASDFYMTRSMLLENCDKISASHLAFFFNKSDENKKPNTDDNVYSDVNWYPQHHYLVSSKESEMDVKSPRQDTEQSDTNNSRNNEELEEDKMAVEVQLKEESEDRNDDMEDGGDGRERKISLVNDEYNSGDESDESLVVGDVKVRLNKESNSMKVRSKWDSDYEPSEEEREQAVDVESFVLEKEVPEVKEELVQVVHEEQEEVSVEEKPTRSKNKRRWDQEPSTTAVTAFGAVEADSTEPPQETLVSEYQEFLKMVSGDQEESATVTNQDEAKDVEMTNAWEQGDSLSGVEHPQLPVKQKKMKKPHDKLKGKKKLSKKKKKIPLKSKKKKLLKKPSGKKKKAESSSDSSSESSSSTSSSNSSSSSSSSSDSSDSDSESSDSDDNSKRKKNKKSKKILKKKKTKKRSRSSSSSSSEDESDEEEKIKKRKKSSKKKVKESKKKKILKDLDMRQEAILKEMAALDLITDKKQKKKLLAKLTKLRTNEGGSSSSEDKKTNERNKSHKKSDEKKKKEKSKNEDKSKKKKSKRKRSNSSGSSDEDGKKDSEEDVPSSKKDKKLKKKQKKKETSSDSESNKKKLKKKGKKKRKKKSESDSTSEKENKKRKKKEEGENVEKIIVTRKKYKDSDSDSDSQWKRKEINQVFVIENKNEHVKERENGSQKEKIISKVEGKEKSNHDWEGDSENDKVDEQEPKSDWEMEEFIVPNKQVCLVEESNVPNKQVCLVEELNVPNKQVCLVEESNVPNKQVCLVEPISLKRQEIYSPGHSESDNSDFETGLNKTKINKPSTQIINPCNFEVSIANIPLPLPVPNILDIPEPAPVVAEPASVKKTISVKLQNKFQPRVASAFQFESDSDENDELRVQTKNKSAVVEPVDETNVKSKEPGEEVLDIEGTREDVKVTVDDLEEKKVDTVQKQEKVVDAETTAPSNVTKTEEETERNTKRSCSPSPRKKSSESGHRSPAKRRRRSPSPRRRSRTPERRRKSRSPRRRSSPDRRRRSRSKSPRRRGRRRSSCSPRRKSGGRYVSPPRRRKHSVSPPPPGQHGDGKIEVIQSRIPVIGQGEDMDVCHSPNNSPGYEHQFYGQYNQTRDVNNLITVQPSTMSPKKLSGSPQRLTLDQRIEIELGVKKVVQQQQQQQTYPGLSQYDESDNYYPSPGYQIPPAADYGTYAGQQPFLPVPPSPVQPTFAPQSYQTLVQPVAPAQSTVIQVGNIVEVVPTVQKPPPPPPLPPPLPGQSKVVQVGNVLQVVPPLPPPAPKATAVVAPTTSVLPELIPAAHAEALINPLLEAMKNEREKRRKEKEKRRAEREARRKVREMKRMAKIKAKSVHDEGLMLGQAIVDEDLIDDVLDIPSPIPSIEIVSGIPLPAAGKGILISPGFTEKATSAKKGVKFADGVCPGESTSGNEERPPSPPKPKLPKEKRYKKKKVKTKKKVKVHIIRQVIQDDDDEEEEDELSPPPPPPGDPPPIFFTGFPYTAQTQYPVYQTQTTTTTLTTVQFPSQHV